MSGATRRGMSPEDVELCRNAVRNLTSEKYKDKNYLFLHPFDLTQTPGYMDVVTKVMDLSTLSKNLEEGHYSNRNDFFQDANLAFENAIAYHQNRAESKWILKPATTMLKVAQRERAKADKGTQKEKMKVDKGSLSGAVSTTMPMTASPTPTTTAATASSSSSSVSGKNKQAPSMKLKLPTKKNKTDKPPKEGGIKLKLKLGGKSSNPPDAAASGTTAALASASASASASATTAKPKVTLKLKTSSATGNAAPAPAPAPATTPRPKVTLKIKTPGAGNAKTPGTGNAASAPASIVKPKVTLKIKTPTTGKQAPSSARTPASAPAPAPTPPVIGSSSKDKEKKKPRLTLKLGKPKTPTPVPAVPETPKVSPKPIATSPDKPAVAAAPVAAPVAVSAPAPAASPSKSTTSTTSQSANTISLKMPVGPRGKELPKGVAPPPPPIADKKKPNTGTTKKVTVKKAGTPKAKAPIPGDASVTSNKSTKSSKSSSTKKKDSSKTKITLKTIPASSSSSSTTTTPTNRGMMLMTPARKAQCNKVLNGLKRRKPKQIGWFLLPVSDKGIVQDYRKKIKFPVDLSTMQSKLDKNEYTSIASFVLDLRRIFANCMRYNTSIKDSLRPIAVEVLAAAEEFMTVLLAKPEHPTQVYPPMLFCWKLCLSVLDTLYNLTNPEDGQPTALYFLHPVSFYCGGQFPPDYLEKVSHPMDFGNVTAQLIEGQYTSIDQFAADCKLVIDNCNTYYGGREDSKIFTDQANRLKEVLMQQLEALNRYLKSSAGEAQKKAAQSAAINSSLPKPPIPILQSTLDELRALKYTDKATKIIEPAMGPFEKPVSVTTFPDYPQHVQSPMDLQTVERKVKSAAYTTPEDFEYDMLLIFNNCVTYNAARKVDPMVAMGKYGLKHFRRLFANKMRAFDDPTASAAPSPREVEVKRQNPPEGGGIQGPPKKMKLEPGVSRGKIASRISLNLGGASAPVASAAPAAQNKAKMPPKPPPVAVPKPKATINVKPNQPVPLHIAISQVKESFPLRRAVKGLQLWEAGCARFFKDMMRHPWISAARPKFIFHVPVPVLFPELREIYAAKIKKPMDLTTVECALLAGNRYAASENFINDVALVFSNAIKFNKDGRDVGDPLSCAYYDASIHLLRYCRWLSHELLSEYVEESDHVDEPDDPPLPLLSWKLTTGNRNKCREEMEAIVLKEPIEKSLEGDRYTWMEAECEKLLKALRHQSDLRYMTFFIQPNYPHDYAAFIAKPMDWERCQKTLKKRHYDKFGDIIDDLRLIFSNALKYNVRHEGTDTVSGRAFDAAKYMSAKLETAISKMMVAVSDRLERERIDHNNAEREIEAQERAEEEHIRAQWKTDAGKEGGAPGTAPEKIESSLKIRTTKRQAVRKENTDFEVPFFDDEDDGQHERSYFDVVRQQKAMFEKQRKDLSKMQQATLSVGAAAFMRMQQRELAVKWVEDEKQKNAKPTDPLQETKTGGPSKSKKDTSDSKEPSSVLSKLKAAGRSTLQIKLAAPKPKPKGPKKRYPALSLD